MGHASEVPRPRRWELLLQVLLWQVDGCAADGVFSFLHIIILRLYISLLSLASISGSRHKPDHKHALIRQLVHCDIGTLQHTRTVYHARIPEVAAKSKAAIGIESDTTAAAGAAAAAIMLGLALAHAGLQPIAFTRTTAAVRA